MFHELLPWEWKLWLAKRGWWQEQGLRGMSPASWPKGQVLYSDGMWSTPMPLGTAVKYAAMFKGTVHPAQEPKK